MHDSSIYPEVLGIIGKVFSHLRDGLTPVIKVKIESALEERRFERSTLTTFIEDKHV